MNLDIINITNEGIENSAANVIQNNGAGVMYLHNYGNKSNEVKIDDMQPWIDEDIDD